MKRIFCWMLTAGCLSLMILLISGCLTKVDPAPNAGFIDKAAMFKAPDLPFQKVWRKQGVDFRDYREIYIAPVNTEHLLQMNWLQETGHGSKIKQDIENFAGYTYQTLAHAFMQSSRRPFLVLSEPKPSALRLDFAIVELVPNKAALKAAGLIPPIAIPMTLVGMTVRSTVAFEARITDCGTGETLALLADREAAKTSIINIKNYTWYSHAKSIVEEWATQLVGALSKNPEEVIKESPWFELKPW